WIGSPHSLLRSRNVKPEARPKSSMHGVSHVPEFIGITHDVDGDDTLMLDLQGSRLENVTPLDGDEPRQAVDKAIAHEARPAHGIDRRDPRKQPHDVIEPGGRRLSSRRLAAAIGVEGYVRREQRAQAFHVAVPGRGEEGFRDLKATFPRHGIAWTVCTNMVTGAARELAAGGRPPADPCCGFPRAP